jgi:hypothetical protein
MTIVNALYHASDITDTASTPATSMANRFSNQDVAPIHIDVPPAPVIILAGALLLVLILLNL